MWRGKEKQAQGLQDPTCHWPALIWGPPWVPRASSSLVVPIQQHLRGQESPQRCREKCPGTWGCGVSGILPSRPRGPSLHSHLAGARRVGIGSFLPAKGAGLSCALGGRARQLPGEEPPPTPQGPRRTLRRARSGVPGPAGRRGPPRGADSPARAPAAAGRPLPAPRAPDPRARAAQPGPHREALQVRGRHGELRRGGRAGRAAGPRRGRAGCGTRSARRLRLNGSNMATSWKLPSAAAAERSSGAAPTPPAGPAPPPGPAESAARALPLGRRGSPRRGGRCRLRGLLGLVVCELGGRGGRCWGASARRPAACPWAEPVGVLRPRPRKPAPWEGSGVLRAPPGSPLPSCLHYVGACKGTGTPANGSMR